MQSHDQTSAERLRKQQRALAEFGLHAFRSRDLDAILHEACVLVGEGLDVKLTKVLELLPDGNELLVRAGVNWRPGVVGVAKLGGDRDSPGGYALRTDGPVLTADVATETRFRIPQVLAEHGVKSMVNVIIVGEDVPFGVLEVDATRPRSFDEDDITFLENCANLLAAAIDRHRAHRAEEEAASEQRMLAQELAHRVKNMLGLAQALVAQTVADEPAGRALRESVLGRLQALSRAEELLFEDHARVLDLAELAERALEPFEGAAGRLVVDGPSLLLPARSGRILSLVLHELATNATKHGAFSTPEGTVRLSWTAEPTEQGSRVRLSWVEDGGPAVQPPERRGFGTRLLTALAEYELDGNVELNHRSSGLHYELVFAEHAG